MLLLVKHNYKISELSKLKDLELETKAKSISLEKLNSNYYINAIIISMFSLDDDLFEEVYQANIATASFEEVFINTFIPLLEHIGDLWQTNGVKPANERFMSNLIYQKILLNIAELPKTIRHNEKVNILFLPKGEMHEIGLLYMLYHLKLSGEKTIYLGRSIPIEDLLSIKNKFQNIHWICSFVIDKTEKEKKGFISDIEKLLINTKCTCSIVGKVWNKYAASYGSGKISFHIGFDKLIQAK